MTDVVTREVRSRMMSGIRGKDTAPELQLRSVLHRSGFRFKLHVKDLPGRPDIVLPRYRAAIFVHGCFWHRHRGCKLAAEPASNVAFWVKKFEDNMERDRRKARQLKKLGWRVIVVWQCQIASGKLSSMFRRLERAPR